jgi:hypothetical protein
LFDIGPISQVNLPVFTPIFGFQSITAPEMTIETQEIPEGHWYYRRKVVRRANVSTITMTRGTSFLDSDFWRWFQVGLTGDESNFPGLFPSVTPRRTLLLMQMFPRAPFEDGAANARTAVGGLAAVTTLGLDGVQAYDVDVGTGIFAGATVAGFGGFVAANASSMAFRIPARAWLLEGCIPTRYKAASDFDATSAAVSIAELDFEVERFEEISLAA